MNLKNLLSLMRCAMLAGGLMMGLVHPAHADVYVTNYGAKGDLLTLMNVACVSNSATISCPSANFSNADVGKMVEVFGGGLYQNPSNQTLVATIVSVQSATSVTLAIPACITATNLNAVYGTENGAAVSAAVAAAATPTDTIIFPAGNYLFVPPAQANYNYKKYGSNHDAFNSVRVARGGLTFLGQGNVILIGMGGWTTYYDTSAGYNASVRATLFQFTSPMTNNYPVVFTNLTFYGGDVGYVGNLAYPPAGSTGLGWDGTHHAIAIINGNGATTFQVVDSFLIENCIFHGWRGEMIIGTVAPANVFMTITNCEFYDGNATALNIPMAHNWVSNYFHDTYEIEEFYRSYATMPSYFQGCTFSNIIGAGFIALNGGYYGNPTYTIKNNNFMRGQYPIFTAPTSELLFISNNLTTSQGIALGVMGYQGSTINSNILVAWNTFNGAQYALSILGNGNNSSASIYFCSNQVNNAWGIGTGYGWSTNVSVFNNAGVNCGLFYENQLQGQWLLDTSNQYNGQALGDSFTATNMFTYAHGSLGQMRNGLATAKYGLDDTQPLKIPAGAMMVISNASPNTYPLYPNAALSGTPVTLASGQTATFYWSNGSWATNSLSNLSAPPPPSPPTNLHPLLN